MARSIRGLHCIAIVLLLAVDATRAAGASRSPFIGMHIQKLLQEFGSPDDFKTLAHGVKVYEWRLRAATEIQTDNSEQRIEELSCTVTVRVSPRERITSVKADVSNITASLYASIGAFGCLCVDGFGMKRSRQPACRVLHAPI